MNEQGYLIGIYICSAEKLQMESKDRILAIAGVGLEGDRYALKTGSYSAERKGNVETKIRHVSLISSEAIIEANTTRVGTSKKLFRAIDTRRNLLTVGVDLNSLVGEQFSINGVIFQGAALCTPCELPSKLSGVDGFKDAFQNGGGIRAEILSTGLLRIGNSIEVFRRSS